MCFDGTFSSLFILFLITQDYFFALVHLNFAYVLKDKFLLFNFLFTKCIFFLSILELELQQFSNFIIYLHNIMLTCSSASRNWVRFLKIVMKAMTLTMQSTVYASSCFPVCWYCPLCYLYLLLWTPIFLILR